MREALYKPGAYRVYPNSDARREVLRAGARISLHAAAIACRRRDRHLARGRGRSWDPCEGDGGEQAPARIVFQRVEDEMLFAHGAGWRQKASRIQNEGQLRRDVNKRRE
jgi:hypothetical protein